MSLAKLLAMGFLCLAALPGHAAEKVAVFPFTIQDSSGAPATGQAARLAAATALLGDVLRRSGRYEIVDLGPYQARIAALQPPDECGECWAQLAAKAGASLEFLPSVQKVSVLISQMTIWVADVKSMKYVAHVQGQIRGDTTEAYTRGVEFLIEDEFLKKR
jgi:hypothetical protein